MRRVYETRNIIGRDYFEILIGLVSMYQRTTINQSARTAPREKNNKASTMNGTHIGCTIIRLP
jgi:hypothetical protein